MALLSRVNKNMEATVEGKIPWRGGYHSGKATMEGRLPWCVKDKLEGLTP